MQPFNSFTKNIQEILLNLEKRDQQEREENVDQQLRLRQIPRESGEFLFQFLLLYATPFEFLGIEIGSSGGYSSIWQALALQKAGHGMLISLELDPKKFVEAQQNIQASEIEGSFIKLIEADAKKYIADLYANVNYVFLDAEKEDYLDYFILLKDRLQSGAVLIADNVISHAEELTEFLDAIQNDKTVISITLPIGKGLIIVRWS